MLYWLQAYGVSGVLLIIGLISGALLLFDFKKEKKNSVKKSKKKIMKEDVVYEDHIQSFEAEPEEIIEESVVEKKKEKPKFKKKTRHTEPEHINDDLIPPSTHTVESEEEVLTQPQQTTGVDYSEYPYSKITTWQKEIVNDILSIEKIFNNDDENIDGVETIENIQSLFNSMSYWNAKELASFQTSVPVYLTLLILTFVLNPEMPRDEQDNLAYQSSLDMNDRSQFILTIDCINNGLSRLSQLQNEWLDDLSDVWEESNIKRLEDRRLSGIAITSLEAYAQDLNGYIAWVGTDDEENIPLIVSTEMLQTDITFLFQIVEKIKDGRISELKDNERNYTTTAILYRLAKQVASYVTNGTYSKIHTKDFNLLRAVGMIDNQSDYATLIEDFEWTN